jgi:hypothetical protein
MPSPIVDRDGGAQRRVGQIALQHIARFEGARQAVRRIRELPQLGTGTAAPSLPNNVAWRRTERRAQGFR